MTSRDDNVIPLPLPPQGEPHPRIARMIAYWREIAPAPGLVPGKQHFDPMRVPDLLPNVWLLDVVREDGSLRYRFRLVGDALIDSGAPFRKGLFVDELGDRVDQAAAKTIHDRVVNTREPDWRRGPPIVKHLKFIALLERVLLPLAEDGRTVDHILAMTVFYQMDGRVS
jgi:hypothetical protein